MASQMWFDIAVFNSVYGFLFVSGTRESGTSMAIFYFLFFLLEVVDDLYACVLVPTLYLKAKGYIHVCVHILKEMLRIIFTFLLCFFVLCIIEIFSVN